ncbi:replication-relaxation family protein [Streptomyces sp. NPDC086766]|uniref:replication-relaxation family protein n=1 Tax=Streptomyces sp. NPDC086766 TaxID=3365754 RepID=UPI00382F48E6
MTPTHPSPLQPAASGPRVSEPLPHQILLALAQHRMATTRQLQTLLRPHASRQALSHPLNQLSRHHLVHYTVLPQSHRTRAWYLTAAGARLTRDHPALRSRPPYPITSTTAASLKTPHTLTVLRTHLAFVTDARRLGHEHGHLDWTPEVSHAIGDGQRLTADALMHYTVTGPQQRRKLRAFVEVDRATMSSERLAIKLIDYARLWTYQPPTTGRRPTPAPPAGGGLPWLRWYPIFPRILFVLTGAGRRTLEHRIDDLAAMTAQHPHVSALARDVPLAAALLEDLEDHGPTQPIWTPLAGGAPRPWTEL